MTNKFIEFDVSLCQVAGVGPEGINPDELQEINPQLQVVHGRIADDLRKNQLLSEFSPLILGQAMQADLAGIYAAAENLRQFHDVLIIGIGGSSLGAKALALALGRENSGQKPQVHFIENIDTYQFRQVLDGLDPATTALVCISKSGGTIESAVHYLVLRDWLDKSVGTHRARQQQWIITDPDQGWLRNLTRSEGIASLPVPHMVGGRYSVLTAVGLLPLAILGIDIQSLLQGAADNAERCNMADFAGNPALEIAGHCFLLDRLRRKRISVMMPYVNRLQLFVDWYCQLWAESLGKWDRNISGSVPAGTLPVRAMGAIDQHSQLQMYLESRHDKFFTFIELDHWEHDRPIPLRSADREQFPYLAGRSMADVIKAELAATRSVITQSGHPSMTIRLPWINAYTMGQLIDFYQRVTIYTGLLYGINPLDQPSVEKGKRLAIQHLSRHNH